MLAQKSCSLLVSRDKSTAAVPFTATLQACISKIFKEILFELQILEVDHNTSVNYTA